VGAHPVHDRGATILEARLHFVPDLVGDVGGRETPAELVVFEDTDVGIASAQAAGAYVVGLTRTLGAERMQAADELVERIDVGVMERLLCS